MADYDSLWKALPEVVTLALLRTILPEVTAPLTPWKTDLTVISQREIDGSFLAWVGDIQVLLHLEYQNYLDSTMPRRIHEYASLLEQQLQAQQIAAAVVPIVIWAVSGATPPAVYDQQLFGKVLCHREYFELHLAALDWQSVDPLLLVLAPYLHGVRREDLPTIAMRLYEAAPVDQQTVLLGALLALSERKFPDFGAVEEAILQQVRKQMDEIMQAIAESSYGIAIFQKGEARGEARGVALGEALGELRGEVKAVQTLWRKKFGLIPEDVEVALSSASGEMLEDLIAQMIDPGFTLDQARAQLGL